MLDSSNLSVWEISEFAMVTLTTVLLAVMGMITTSSSGKAHRFGKWFRKWGWYCIAIAVIGTIVFHAKVTDEHHKYDPELVLRFEDKFEGMKPQRVQAATAIYEYLQNTNWDSVTNTDDLDDVLGFFDELGFYWKNGELSATVLHEHFYDVMRIYDQGAHEYILNNERQESPADFEYVEPLFKKLTQIEAARIHRQPPDWRVDKTNLLEDLKSEMRLEKNK